MMSEENKKVPSINGDGRNHIKIENTEMIQSASEILMIIHS
ncbi:hypothetical protein [Limosilactobacillus agrestis]|nr:hypothetical protein [Limosilactobacillus agrestis]